MSCPHSLKPGPCSQCVADAPVQVVTTNGPVVLVDGAPAGRSLDPLETTRSYYARRGGKQHGRRRQG